MISDINLIIFFSCYRNKYTSLLFYILSLFVNIMLNFAILFQLKYFYDYNPINLNLLYYYSPHQLTYLYIDKSLRSLNNYNPLTQTTTRYPLLQYYADHEHRRYLFKPTYTALGRNELYDTYYRNYAYHVSSSSSGSCPYVCVVFTFG